MLQGIWGQTEEPLVSWNTIGIFLIIFPTGWIGFDGTGNPVHIAFAPDDMFIIIALPDGTPHRILHTVDSFGDNGFELRHHRAQRIGL